MHSFTLIAYMNKTIVFYDGGCSMCVGITGWISKLDGKRQFELIPYQNGDYLKAYPQINPADCEKEIHVVTRNGNVIRGADAMLEIWRTLGHPTSFFAYVFRLPPFIWIGRFIYRIVARYRKSIYE
jgi:predicted DCC family thiol-disulfide oxidoreductase YuxK